MPREEISISGYGDFVVEFARAVGLRDKVDVIGNSMGGFIAAEEGITHADFARRIVLASAAGISITNLKRRPVLTAARIAAAATNVVLARPDAMAKRPGLRHLALGYVFRHPSRIAPDLAYQVMVGTGKPGFLDALDALTPDLSDEPDCAHLLTLAPALRVRALKRWAERLTGRAVTSVHLDALRALVEDWSGQGPVRRLPAEAFWRYPPSAARCAAAPANP